MDLPYKAEYAKSSRASCKGCKTKIEAQSLRLAVMVQSFKFDGKTPSWFHEKCFFLKQRPKNVADIDHFGTLRPEDRKRIQDNVANLSAAVVPQKKGKKRAAAGALKDFAIENAKSGRAMCRGCDIKISKDEVRISKKDFETDIGKKYGGQDMWHHVTCFANLRAELGYFACGDQLPGFKGLSPEDQNEVKKQIPAIKQEDVPLKKPKLEDEASLKEDQLNQQMSLYYKYRDQLKDSGLSKKDYIVILEMNKQFIPTGTDDILNHLADVLTFGALESCKKCQSGKLLFTKLGYVCQGDLTEWSKCSELYKEPFRKTCKIPSDLKSSLKSIKPKTDKRIILELKPTVKKEVKQEDEVDHKPKVQRERPPLYEMLFVLLGTLSKDKDSIKKDITKMGGKVVTKIQGNVVAIISTPKEVEKMNSRMLEAEAEEIHVVSEDFLQEAPNHVGKIAELVVKKSICSWGKDPTKRMPDLTKSRYKSKSIYEKSGGSGMVKLKVIDGAAVDPESGLVDKAKVYTEGETKYAVVLTKTDIQTNKNSYYKMQVLQRNNGKGFYVFRSWGRIGTKVGDTKLQECSSLYEAKEIFENLFSEKTENTWGEEFCKFPGMYFPMEIDYGQDNVDNLDIVEADSKLPVQIQSLIRLIFDVNSMRKLMLEFELDTEKMPLGKLTRRQIQNAYSVLTELTRLMEQEEPSEGRLIDATNRFYTLIPHTFGVDMIPVIRSKEVVQQKILMLDNLNEMEIAYDLMKTSGSEHTIDSYYSNLNTQIEVLDKATEEFKILNEYIRNTHAATHNDYQLTVEDIFTIKRDGEEKRFKPFKKLHNHKLLWHGSRTTNFAGILSQGLRIAPPEAPVAGYMFGKGIYFADMVSKSANYCCATPDAPTGLLLLCDVALGEMYERENADYIKKLPKGKHSTKGIGRTEPDPKETKMLDGVEVPLGKGVSLKNRNKSSLLYNEYIVYDVAQVNVRYLLKVKFDYQY